MGKNVSKRRKQNQNLEETQHLKARQRKKNLWLLIERRQPERWEKNRECGVREAKEERVVDGGRYLCLVMLKD